MTAPSIEPSVCPLCGQPNRCGAAAGEAECWCYSAAIPNEVLERVPQAAKGVACVCRNCAANRASPPEPLEQLNKLLRQRG